MSLVLGSIFGYHLLDSTGYRLRHWLLLGTFGFQRIRWHSFVSKQNRSADFLKILFFKLACNTNRFGIVNAFLIYLYTASYQKVDEDEFGGMWDILKEGFMTSFSTFLVSEKKLNLIFNLKKLYLTDLNRCFGLLSTLRFTHIKYQKYVTGPCTDLWKYMMISFVP